jgi:hypothetical protein
MFLFVPMTSIDRVTSYTRGVVELRASTVRTSHREYKAHHRVSRADTNTLTVGADAVYFREPALLLGLQGWETVLHWKWITLASLIPRADANTAWRGKITWAAEMKG